MFKVTLRPYQHTYNICMYITNITLYKFLRHYCMHNAFNVTHSYANFRVCVRQPKHDHWLNENSQQFQTKQSNKEMLCAAY